MTLRFVVVSRCSSVGTVVIDSDSAWAVQFFTKLAVVKLYCLVPFSRRVFDESVAASYSKGPSFASFGPFEVCARSAIIAVITVIARRF